MNYYVVMPAYNEALFIGLTLESVVTQTLLPKKLVVVNDNSTDETAEIVQGFVDRYPFIELINKTSEAIHLPGSKVVRAFETGYDTLDDNYSIIVKLDADLILPNNYFEKIMHIFSRDASIGMVGGFAYVEKNGKWVLENLTDKDHIRGAFKAYRKILYWQFLGLRPAMGWDTVDELLARFYEWKIVTVPELKIKHLKPTGAKYDQTARYNQGMAFYTLGYGFWITAIASAKLAILKKKPLLFFDYMKGFRQAKAENRELLVDDRQAAFIRKYRWKKMRTKIFGDFKMPR